MPTAAARWSATATCPSGRSSPASGPVEVKQPRVQDRRPEETREHFSPPRFLPPYLRKTKSLEELIPWLYLKGISTGDFRKPCRRSWDQTAQASRPRRSRGSRAVWEEEYQEWSTALLGRQAVRLSVGRRHPFQHPSGRRPAVHSGADGSHNRRKEGADRRSTDGYRESEQSWNELLLDVKARGLAIDPKLAIGDGALGFWKALRPGLSQTTRTQRCWVHKTANVLDKLPKRISRKPRAERTIAVASSGDASDGSDQLASPAGGVDHMPTLHRHGRRHLAIDSPRGQGTQRRNPPPCSQGD